MENGEVIALLDIAKCLYDAIARMERAAEKGKAIAAAVEGVEKHWGTSVSGTWDCHQLKIVPIFLFCFSICIRLQRLNISFFHTQETIDAQIHILFSCIV